MVTETQCKNILIIDDEKFMQDMYSMMLRPYSSEYKIDYANSVIKGLNQVKGKDYDLVILDMIMEPDPGIQVYFELRRKKATENIPVLVVSVISVELLEELKAKTDVDFLQKPITREKLVKKIEQMIK